MTSSDTDLRDALAPLRGDQPTDADVAAVLAAAPARPPRTRRSTRRLAVVLAASTAVGIALAALPGPVPERPGEEQASGSILRAAAAVAAEQPPATLTGYRYAQWIQHWRWEEGPNAPAPIVEIEEKVETWVDRNWRGRIEAQPARVIAGGEFAQRFVEKPSRPYQWGDTAPPDAGKLPTEPDALREALIEHITSKNWAPGLPTDDDLHYYLTRLVLSLLGDSRTSPPLRAGLFGVLARTPGVAPAPDARDALGRGGQAVRIPARPRKGVVTVIFDRETSELLYWSIADAGGGTPDQEHTLVRAGEVDAIGDRP